MDIQKLLGDIQDKHLSDIDFKEAFGKDGKAATIAHFGQEAFEALEKHLDPKALESLLSGKGGDLKSLAEGLLNKK